MDETPVPNNGDADRKRAPAEFGFDAPGEPWVSRLRSSMRSPLPSSIGDYIIDGEVSRGGQGIVYRGRHASTGKPAALKCLHAGVFSTDDALNRFDREIRLTSALHHPGVVEIFGVETMNGQPVIAMEWIDGETVKQWARSSTHARSADDIVRVTIAICAAIHHAHQHGVLHRDLKPSNVLIDSQGQPKVVDFGVAKQISSEHTHALTASGEFVGTLAYAAPEQIRDGSRALDVRADVWAIGVILYEMLTGRRPYEPGDSIAEAVRAIEHAQMPRPSSLAPGVGFELDTIVLKALADEPEMRYQSVDAMGEDLRRLLDNQPILAHPPSTWYQIRKLVSRNRRPVLLSSIGIILLVVLGVVSLVQAGTIARASQREAKANKLAADVTAYIHELFRDLSPTASTVRSSVMTMVERATQRIDEHFDAGSLIRADLRDTIGTMLLDLGHFELAVTVLNDALEIRHQIDDGDTDRTAAAHYRLARGLESVSDYSGAESHLDRALALYERDAPAHFRAITSTLQSLAVVKRKQGQYEAAETLLHQNLARMDAEDRFGRASTLQLLSELHDLRADYAAANQVNAEVLKIQRAEFGAQHPAVAAALQSLGSSAESCGDLAAAEAAFEEALQIFDDLLGRDHPRTAELLIQLGELRVQQGRLPEALDHFKQAQETLIQVRNGDTEAFANALQSQAAVLMHTQGFDEAERLLRDSLAIIRRRRQGPQHFTAAILANLAAVLGSRGFEALAGSRELNADLREARTLLLEAKSIREQLPGPDPIEISSSLNGLGAIASYVGDHDSAEKHYLEAAKLIGEAFPSGHLQLITVTTNLANVARDRARTLAAAKKAKPDFAEALRRYAEVRRLADSLGLSADHQDRIFFMGQLALVQKEGGYAKEYKATLEEVVAADKGNTPDPHNFMNGPHVWLVDVLLAERDTNAAMIQLQALHEKLDRFKGQSADPSILDPRYLKLYELRGDEAKAAEWRAKIAKAKKASAGK